MINGHVVVWQWCSCRASFHIHINKITICKWITAVRKGEITAYFRRCMLCTVLRGTGRLLLVGTLLVSLSFLRLFKMRRLAMGLGAGVTGAGVIAVSLQGREASLALHLAHMELKLRPVLGDMLPNDLYVWLYSASRPAIAWALAQPPRSAPTSISACDNGNNECEKRCRPLSAMGSLRFRNDLGNAAGFDKDGSLLSWSYAQGAGYAVVGTVLNEPHTGNLFRLLGGLWRGTVWMPLPRCGGSLNSLGLPSHGVDVAVANIAAFRAEYGIRADGCGGDAGFPIGVSVMGHPSAPDEGEGNKLDGVLECVRKLVPVADFIELNESCPNVAHGKAGHSVGGTASRALELRLRAIIEARDSALASEASVSQRKVPILVKVGGVGEADAEDTVRFFSRVGIDGLVVLNTQKDYNNFNDSLPEGDAALLQHYTSRFGGGLSGAPIRARSLAQVTALCEAVERQGLRDRFTIVHVGGIADNEDVLASRAAGAPLRQWYTGLMHGVAACEPDDVAQLYNRTTAVRT